jgi:putative tricarboxylic transport membrane protein
MTERPDLFWGMIASMWFGHLMLIVINYVLIMAAFGLFGHLLTKIRCEPAPLILGFILGPMLEENFPRSLIISRGSWWVFLERPICEFRRTAGAADGARALSPLTRSLGRRG